MGNNNLKLIVMKSAKELGEKVNQHLQELNNTTEDYRLPINEVRFSNGEGKVCLEETAREKDLYILTDVNNYSVTYQMYGYTHNMGPDEHFQDIKRVISATNGHASRISVVMPLLYESRQHRRKGRESLDCAASLQELEHLGVKEIITFDAHDENIANSIPSIPFDNFYPTRDIIEQLIAENPDILDNLLVVSPDMGAVERARFYAEVFGVDVGMFYKRRDGSKIINGKNPVIEHVYLGSNVRDKNIIIVDDMIASGGSVIEVAQELKKRGANKVIIITTFALFTGGIDKFNYAKEFNFFDNVYSTNLTYVPQAYKLDWYHEVDCSLYLANIINNLNQKKSIEELVHNKKDLTYKVRSLVKHSHN